LTGGPGRIKLAKNHAGRISTDEALARLFGKFSSAQGLSEDKFDSLKKEMELAFRALELQGMKRHQGIFWSPIENGSVVLVILSDSRFGVTEIGMLFFGSIGS
jgi:hypothetical protein